MIAQDTSTPRDFFQRPLRDLRISVTDNCNFRCTYCMPASEKYTFLKKDEWLNFKEIQLLASLFVKAGVKKLRITGGEPLLRPNLSDLIKDLSELAIEDLSITTNGYLLKPHLIPLFQAGLKRLTVSLDSIHGDTFSTMSGGRYEVHRVLDNLEKAREIGFESIKVNCVVQRGVNDHQIEDLLKWCCSRGLIPRFIEYMDVGNKNQWMAAEVVPSSEILSRLSQHYNVVPMEENYFGEVASRYLLDDKWEIGFISSVSQPFCGSCTRARLSTDGKIYTCLFSGQGTEVKSLLRSKASPEDIFDFLTQLWKKRNDRYSEVRSTEGVSREKVEMYQIGG
ncbi:MAG: GTP 3',8-cyclase MoaA [Candidatus Cloacimonetes bacterium]|nr:GTP 3',8-cyclase MoaA [Candidatus Cloacimonadota bacterium]